MRYGEVLTRSFDIAWRHRYLWFLAVLAGEGAGGGFNGSGNYGGRSGGGGGNGTGVNPSSQAIGDWIGGHLGLIVALALVLVLVAIGLFLLSCVAQGGLVRAAAEHDADRPYSLGPAWSAGVASFWRILGLKLLSALIGLLILLVFGVLIVGAIASGSNHNGGATAGLIVLAILLAIALIPLLIVWSWVLQLATRVVVLELQGPVRAIRRGFELVFHRFGRVALVWLISVGIGIAAGIVLAILLLIVAIPFFVLGVVAFAASSSGFLVAVVVIGAIVLIALALVAGGAVGAYFSTYWTLAFRRLDLDPLPAAPPAGAPAPA